MRRRLGYPYRSLREEAIDDALLAAALLRKHDRLDPKRVVILGHSLGGTLAPRIGVADPALAGLVIVAGATRPLLDAAREQLTYLGSLNPGGPSVDESIKMLVRAAPAAYWKDLDSYNPGETAAKLTMPMLILQGERDYQVTMADLEGWRKALSGKSGVTIKSYPTQSLFHAGRRQEHAVPVREAGSLPDFVLDDIAAWIRLR